MKTPDRSISKRTRVLRNGRLLFRNVVCSRRLWGYGAFILMSLLSASFYPVAKPTLQHIDTALFLAAQMVWLLPAALFCLIWSHWRMSWSILLWGCGLGSCMSIALLCLTLAMTSTSMTETAICSCLNGLIVVLLLWLLCRQRISLLTWLACLCSAIGIIVLLSVSTMHWAGDLLALFGGVLLLSYSFLTERLWHQSRQSNTISLRAIFGIELLTMVVEMLLYAFFFGHWQVIHFILPQDNLTFAYVGLATTLLPMITMITMRRYVNGVLLTFLGTLEPVAGAAFAYLFAHERFGPFVYLSGALIIGSLVLQAWTSTTEKPVNEKEKHQPFQQERLLQTSVSRMYLPQGRYTQQLLTTLWPMSEGVDLPTLHRLTGLPSGSLHRFLSILKKRGYIISYQNARMIPCYRIHPSWCVSTHLQLDFNR